MNINLKTSITKIKNKVNLYTHTFRVHAVTYQEAFHYQYG